MLVQDRGRRAAGIDSGARRFPRLGARLWPVPSVAGRTVAVAAVLFLAADVDLSLRRELFKDFYLNISGLDSFDSRPPAEAANKDDLRATVSFGYAF